MVVMVVVVVVEKEESAFNLIARQFPFPSLLSLTAHLNELSMCLLIISITCTRIRQMECVYCCELCSWRSASSDYYCQLVYLFWCISFSQLGRTTLPYNYYYDVVDGISSIIISSLSLVRTLLSIDGMQMWRVIAST